MDIKIEVVGKEEELDFPYVVEYESGEMIYVVSKGLNHGHEVTGIVIKEAKTSIHSVGKFSGTWNTFNIKRYKIIDFNLKLKEV